MPTNRTKLSLNKTLLIILGILLACLLTLNARSLYSADAMSLPKKATSAPANNSVDTGMIEKIGSNALENLFEKVASL